MIWVFVTFIKTCIWQPIYKYLMILISMCVEYVNVLCEKLPTLDKCIEAVQKLKAKTSPTLVLLTNLISSLDWYALPNGWSTLF